MRRFFSFSLVLAVCLAPVAVPAGDDAEAVKALLERIRKKDERAIPALAKRGAAAVPGLIEVLKEGNAEVQPLVMQALGQIGPAATAAIPHLAEGLTQSPNDVLAAQAATAPGRIEPAAVPD